MARRAPRTDGNHAEIRDALRQAGATVFDAAALGAGFPDLVVGSGGMNYLLEVKDGTQPPSRRQLSDDEKRFHESWRGQVAVVLDLDEALAVLDRR